jgi:hypothetical protein
MSTHVTTPKAEPAPLPANAYCPTCGQVLPPLQIQEFPKAMYKSVPAPKTAAAAEEEELQVIVVHDSEEEKKKAGEGYSKDVPKSKATPEQHSAKKP